MEFAHRYFGESSVTHDAAGSNVSFAPDTLRPPVFFSGEIAGHLPFREAISAMHDVVVADLRTLPRERTEYFAWLKQQEATQLAQYVERAAAAQARTAQLKVELEGIRKRRGEVLGPFYTARQKYFDHIYKHDFSRWVVLDPVITVHPDRVLFECFSRDESSYAVLACEHELFRRAGEMSCGTTNIDYSAGLYDAFQQIRSYRSTRLAIEPAGFAIKHDDDPGFVEHKIDVPESWVRGFLQVSTAMTQPGATLELHPMDVYNLCHLLRRKKERVGPRSLRFELTPGAPVRVVLEPWNVVLECPRSTHDAVSPQTVRVWGRRRLHVLQRLIPLAQGFSVRLLGTGMPSFWVARLPGMQFTLGLSGWTANDWSRNAQFDLMGAREHADAASRASVYDALCRHWSLKPEAVARETGLDPAVAESCLTLLTQAGRVMYDLAQGVYRLRELTREPLPIDTLRYANERESQAATLVAAGGVREFAVREGDSARTLSAEVREENRRYQPTLTVDGDERIQRAQCSCDFFFRNRLRRGPCAHLVALRLVDAQRRGLARAARAAEAA